MANDQAQAAVNAQVAQLGALRSAIAQAIVGQMAAK